MTLTAEQNKIITREVAVASRRVLRKWPHLDAADVEQEGWLISLEAVPRYQPGKHSLGAYVGAALGLALRNYAYRTRLSVKYPKNKEYQHAKGDAFKTASDTALVNKGIEAPYARMHLRDAVDGALCALTRNAAQLVRPIVLGERTAAAQATITGVAEDQLENDAEAVRVRLANDPALEEYI